MKRIALLIRIGGILTTLLGAGVAILTSGTGRRSPLRPDDERIGREP